MSKPLIGWVFGWAVHLLYWPPWSKICGTEAKVVKMWHYKELIKTGEPTSENIRSFAHFQDKFMRWEGKINRL